MLPDSVGKEILERYEAYHAHKTLMVAVKGFDERSLDAVRKLDRLIGAMDSIDEKKPMTNSALQQHLQTYRLFNGSVDREQIGSLNVDQELLRLYRKLTDSFFPEVIDAYDPLGLIKPPTPLRDVPLREGHLILPGHGFVSYFDVKADTLEQYGRIYDALQQLLMDEKLEQVTLFSPFFYYVENSQAIREDINRIMVLALFVLIVLYAVVLRTVALLVHTLMSLLSSGMVAVMVLTFFYEQVSLFSVVFGIAISSVAIDYMFHHYCHNYYSGAYRFNRDVFLGYMTTVGTFLLLSCSSFVLIQQISIFAIVSLSLSYLHFALLYPKVLRFTYARRSWSIPSIGKKVRVDMRSLFLLSLATILLSPLWLLFDGNVKNLDYHNQALEAKEQIFASSSMQGTLPVVIQAPDIDTLIKRARLLKKDTDQAYIPLAQLVDQRSYEQGVKRFKESFENLRGLIASSPVAAHFRADFFHNSYKIAPQPHYTPATLQHLGIYVAQMRLGEYITYGTIDQESYERHSVPKYVQIISAKTLFEKSFEKSLYELIGLGGASIGLIVLVFVWRAGKQSMRALTFITFPVAVIALYGLVVPFNILHIFMIFVVIAIGIDYGIYSTRPDELSRTKQAIGYSLLSTFAGFGVLIFSQMPALYSIGTVATIAIVALYLLIGILVII
jgi:predicted exporter